MITIPAFAKPAPPLFVLTLQQGNSWKVEATMTEQEARNLASECRLRGLTASVKAVA